MFREIIKCTKATLHTEGDTPYIEIEIEGRDEDSVRRKTYKASHNILFEDGLTPASITAISTDIILAEFSDRIYKEMQEFRVYINRVEKYAEQIKTSPLASYLSDYMAGDARKAASLYTDDLAVALNLEKSLREKLAEIKL